LLQFTKDLKESLIKNLITELTNSLWTLSRVCSYSEIYNGYVFSECIMCVIVNVCVQNDAVWGWSYY